ncbi:MAG: MATE family efflux transporter [Bowdeniella nasicola]|nr:MATE family efflux transporter [Bowdeniella nasicola]
MSELNPQREVQPSQPSVHRQILALAVPALGALVAEPIFVLADSAMVGHLGTPELAGLSLASTLLTTVVGLCVFLAYASTAATARKAGAGDTRGAVRDGIDGMWLALLIGALLALLIGVGAPVLVALFHPGAAVIPHALAYLRASAPGLPGMLLVLAATGVLRGLLDTRTPLIVASAGAVANIGANAALIYGFGLGVAGSGAGTAIVQSAMGLTLGAVVVVKARRAGVSVRPRADGLWRSTRAGLPLFVRTASLRVAILATVATATALGSVVLAGYQVVNAVWGLTAFALDALAIAAQALVGQALGRGNPRAVSALLRITLTWGVLAGVVIGLILVVGSPWITPLFTPDPALRTAATSGLVTIGILMPLAGWVFVLDGILIGAGDGVYLAWAGLVNLLAYLPALAVIWYVAPEGESGLLWLWVGFAGVFMAARAATTTWRVRGTTWMRLND